MGFNVLFFSLFFRFFFSIRQTKCSGQLSFINEVRTYCLHIIAMRRDALNELGTMNTLAYDIMNWYCNCFWDSVIHVSDRIHFILPFSHSSRGVTSASTSPMLLQPLLLQQWGCKDASGHPHPHLHISHHLDHWLITDLCHAAPKLGRAPVSFWCHVLGWYDKGSQLLTPHHPSPGKQ